MKRSNKHFFFWLRSAIGQVLLKPKLLRGKKPACSEELPYIVTATISKLLGGSNCHEMYKKIKTFLALFKNTFGVQLPLLLLNSILSWKDLFANKLQITGFLRNLVTSHFQLFRCYFSFFFVKFDESGRSLVILLSDDQHDGDDEEGYSHDVVQRILAAKAEGLVSDRTVSWTEDGGGSLRKFKVMSRHWPQSYRNGGPNKESKLFKSWR